MGIKTEFRQTEEQHTEKRKVLGPMGLPGALIICTLSTFLMAPSAPEGASSSEATNVDQGPNRNEAGPSNPGPREYNSPEGSFPTDPNPFPVPTEPNKTTNTSSSALEQRTNDLLEDNLKERKGDLGDGQRSISLSLHRGSSSLTVRRWLTWSFNEWL